MFNQYYLANLCQRRSWPDPYYQVYCSHAGYRCVVRVNNRQYQTCKFYASEETAREGAATEAYGICRNFSASDGMYPAGFAHGGVIQGNPIPVGSGRHSRRPEATTPRGGGHYREESTSTASRSGGSSPDFPDEPRRVEKRQASRHQVAYPTLPATEAPRSRHSRGRY